MLPVAEPVDYPALANLLRRGGIVACATETLVGLLADALDAATVIRLANLKGRPVGQAMPIILPHAGLLPMVAKPLSRQAEALAASHWPGPLTLVTWAREGLPAEIVAEGKVGLRVPGLSPARLLLEAFAGPLTATSANLSGEPPTDEPTAISRRLVEHLDAIVPGSAPGGLPSTVVDVTTDPPRVLRFGAIELPSF